MAVCKKNMTHFLNGSSGVRKLLFHTARSIRQKPSVDQNDPIPIEQRVVVYESTPKLKAVWKHLNHAIQTKLIRFPENGKNPE